MLGERCSMTDRGAFRSDRETQGRGERGARRGKFWKLSATALSQPSRASLPSHRLRKVASGTASIVSSQNLPAGSFGGPRHIDAVRYMFVGSDSKQPPNAPGEPGWPGPEPSPSWCRWARPEPQPVATTPQSTTPKSARSMCAIAWMSLPRRLLRAPRARCDPTSRPRLGPPPPARDVCRSLRRRTRARRARLRCL